MPGLQKAGAGGPLAGPEQQSPAWFNLEWSTDRLIDRFCPALSYRAPPMLSLSPPAFMADTRLGRGNAIHIVTVKVIIFGTNEPVWHCSGVSALYIRAVPFSVS